jgi:ABC-2 type transport system permease protein
MTASARPLPAAPRPVSVARRIYGLGSIFGKTLRDSRRAMLIVGGWTILILFIAGAAMASTFGTIETRAEGVTLTTSLPDIILGLYGGTQPNVVTFGGFVNWRYGLLFLLVPGVWSLLALSSTLVGEAQRGSMEFVAGAASRRRVVLEKLGGHLAGMTLVMLVIAFVFWLVGGAFGTLSAADTATIGGIGGDEVPLEAALSYVLLMGMLGLAAGSIAFALSSFVGRGGAAGIAGIVLVGSWVIYGYRESIGVFDALTPLSWFSWTAGHRPIAGTYDWPSLLSLLAIIVVGGIVGLLAFERRDLGAIGSVRLPGLPKALLGVGGPLARSFGDRMVGAFWWGVGLGLFALAIAASGDQLRESIADQPAIVELFEVAFPNLDINAPGFGLQIAFLAFGYLAAAAAAGTLVGGWASDELEGRLEMVLSTAASRARWFVRSALGAFAAIALFTVVVGVAIALGVATTGEDPLAASLGAGALGLYAAAVAGIGFAVGGLVRNSLAAVAVYVVAVANILLDILVPALQLPDWVHELALTAHFGEPMVGSWDRVGVVVSLALGIGGVLIGAWGFSRRDLRG